MIVAIGCVAVLAFVVMPLLSRSSCNRARLTKDATQIRGIHQSWLVFSREFNGVLPTPGLMRRLPDPVMGDTPGRGTEDITQNTTANLFSLCIMRNFISPELCIGPTEPSSHVRVLSDEAFNYKAYAPAKNVFWNTTFRADLHDVSNVSYAHMPLFGDDKAKQWRESLDSTFVVLGNRGPLGGAPDPKSVTNEIHGRRGGPWSGYVVNNDNHTELVTEFPRRKRGPGLSWIISPESLRADGVEPDTDALITFTKSMTDAGPVVEHD